MRPLDVAGFAWTALVGSRLRAALIVIAMAIGVGGVVVLTWLGDAARTFVAGEFRALGTDLVIVLPGRSETTGGGAPPLLGETPRDLTLDDALALAQSRAVRRVAPIVFGMAPVAYGRLDREGMILGTTPEFFGIRHVRIGQGRLWSGEPDRAQPVCVLGARLKRELFGDRPALGEQVRIGDRRVRVVGVASSEGRSIGLDLEDLVVMPVASAQALFDAPGLFRVIAEADGRDAVSAAERDIRRIVRARHDGEDDVTVITQESVLGAFDEILAVLTMAVGGIASISLIVAGILIMNVMVVAVTQRQEEIGLLKALGASQQRIRTLFLVESAFVAVLGAVTGIALGEALSWVGHRVFPDLAPGAPAWAAAAALAVALVSGLVFGLQPARRAARLDPVEALSRR